MYIDFKKKSTLINITVSWDLNSI